MKRLFTGCVVLVGAACARAGEAPQQICTLAACESGVSVLLGSGYATPVTVEVGPVGGTPQRHTCEDDVACTAGLFFANLSAPELQIRVMSATDTFARTVRPDYRIVHPNGPDCPPTCRQAQIRLGDAAPDGSPSQSGQGADAMPATKTLEAGLHPPSGRRRSP